MAASQLNAILRHIRRSISTATAAVPTDSGLLARFVNDKDPAAFEALVQRHGSMVLGVCRRVLGNVHDAEDAFQATFLVLIGKAASIRKYESLSQWLYGVAYRIALKARALAARRAWHESQAFRSAAADPLPGQSGTTYGRCWTKNSTDCRGNIGRRSCCVISRERQTRKRRQNFAARPARSRFAWRGPEHSYKHGCRGGAARLPLRAWRFYWKRALLQPSQLPCKLPRSRLRRYGRQAKVLSPAVRRDMWLS